MRPVGSGPIIFETRHRARFREIDAYGHMNMSYYLQYYTDHRFEGMQRFVGLDAAGIMGLPIQFHTRRLEIDYIRPVSPDQEFVITSYVDELKRSMCYVAFEMKDPQGTLLSRCRMKIGCIDRATQKPTAWPSGLMERFFHTSVDEVKADADEYRV